ncbi:putative serine/threonine-protein kinase [Porphyridium purpureum]|uniref:Putative serine/threonine-protein kinase n=1 Tax=Porphyridium purpureum TaxID=35688 RepID=A0A5J4YYT2_PORPP|nr:putative serine/threonine-protein kinase [Porphyridium purpureum]|eukprot:POR9590..scf209_3
MCKCGSNRRGASGTNDQWEHQRDGVTSGKTSLSACTPVMAAARNSRGISSDGADGEERRSPGQRRIQTQQSVPPRATRTRSNRSCASSRTQRDEDLQEKGAQSRYERSSGNVNAERRQARQGSASSSKQVRWVIILVAVFLFVLRRSIRADESRDVGDRVDQLLGSQAMKSGLQNDALSRPAYKWNTIVEDAAGRSLENSLFVMVGLGPDVPTCIKCPPLFQVPRVKAWLMYRRGQNLSGSHFDNVLSSARVDAAEIELSALDYLEVLAGAPMNNHRTVMNVNPEQNIERVAVTGAQAWLLLSPQGELFFDVTFHFEMQTEGNAPTVYALSRLSADLSTNAYAISLTGQYADYAELLHLGLGVHRQAGDGAQVSLEIPTVFLLPRRLFPVTADEDASENDVHEGAHGKTTPHARPSRFPSTVQFVSIILVTWIMLLSLVGTLAVLAYRYQARLSTNQPVSAGQVDVPLQRSSDLAAPSSSGNIAGRSVGIPEPLQRLRAAASGSSDLSSRKGALVGRAVTAGGSQSHLSTQSFGSNRTNDSGEELGERRPAIPIRERDTSGYQQYIIPRRNVTLGAVVGAGGTGIVHRAKYGGEQVAVKILQRTVDKNTRGQSHSMSFTQGLDQKDVIKTLPPEALQEIVTFAWCRHPHVAHFYGVCVGDSVDDEEPLWLVMELAPKGTLHDLLNSDQNRLLNDSWRQKVCYFVSLGMEYLHASPRNIFHGDLKPGNIIMTDGGLPKVIDFGISSFYDRQSEGQQARLRGTLMFMAPELFLVGGEPLGREGYEKVDVYAFGVTVWVIFHHHLLGGAREKGSGSARSTDRSSSTMGNTADIQIENARADPVGTLTKATLEYTHNRTATGGQVSAQALSLRFQDMLRQGPTGSPNSWFHDKSRAQEGQKLLSKLGLDSPNVVSDTTAAQSSHDAAPRMASVDAIRSSVDSDDDPDFRGTSQKGSGVRMQKSEVPLSIVNDFELVLSMNASQENVMGPSLLDLLREPRETPQDSLTLLILETEKVRSAFLEEAAELLVRNPRRDVAELVARVAAFRGRYGFTMMCHNNVPEIIQTVIRACTQHDPRMRPLFWECSKMLYDFF